MCQQQRIRLGKCPIAKDQQNLLLSFNLTSLTIGVITLFIVVTRGGTSEHSVTVPHLSPSVRTPPSQFAVRHSVLCFKLQIMIVLRLLGYGSDGQSSPRSIHNTEDDYLIQ